MLRFLPLPRTRRVEKFKFIVIRGNKDINYCKYPKQDIQNHIRGYTTNYYDNFENLIQQVIYPPELWFTSVDEFDPIEQKINFIKNETPDWSEIIITSYI